jgi:hypothetical protein
MRHWPLPHSLSMAAYFHLTSIHDHCTTSDIRPAMLGAGTSVVSVSLTDRLVNLLLSVPIAFFAFGALSRPGKAVRNLFYGFSCICVLCVSRQLD